MKRKPKFVLPTKYILLILSGVCIVAILLSFTLGISGGPLNTVAGYVFIPMQRGINSVGSWIGEKYNINPVALASRVRQEQGAGTSDTSHR